MTPEVRAMLDAMSIHGAGPFEALGKLIGGALGGYWGFKTGLTLQALYPEIPGLPFWGMVGGAYAGSQILGGIGKMIDEALDLPSVQLW